MQRVTRFGAVLISSTALCAQAAWGATYVVQPDGSGDFPTIQAAVNAATTGDVIRLGSGVFSGAGNYNVDYDGKAITIESMTGDPADCVIDCQALGRGFTFEGDEDLDSILRGVTVRNGLAGSTLGSVGGAVRCGKPGFGGIFPDYYGSPTIEDCVFEDCAAAFGGAVSCTTDSAPMLLRCRFESNALSFGIGSHDGAGMYVHESSPTLVDCVFVENDTTVAGGRGGGFFSEASTAHLHDCVFARNAAGLGGGICTLGGLPVIEECTLYANAADTEGGGMYFAGSLLNPTVTSCTLYGNVGGFAGGAGITARSFAQVALVRSIIAMSTNGEAVTTYTSANVTMTCCDVYGNEGGPGAVAGQIGVNHNFAAYPGFCDPSAEVFTIRSESPCAPANAPCGQLVGALDVSCSGPLTYDVCLSGATDFLTIQQALDAALHGDTVELCDGTFTGDGNRDLDFGGKDLVLRSASDDPMLCVIDCQGTPGGWHRGVSFTSGETNAAVLRGITIIGGYVTGVERGGAVWCDAGSSPTLMRCRFVDNHSDWEGGAIACDDDAAPTLVECVVSNNTADGHGGGMVCAGTATVAVYACVFSGNSALDDGGGIAAFAPIEVADTLFELNETITFGGGVAAFFPASFSECTFARNHAGTLGFGFGGGVSGGGSFARCTFDGNTAEVEGGAVYGGGQFGGCTLHGNGAPLAGGISGGGTADNTIIAFGTLGEAVVGAMTLTCSDVHANAGGPGTVGPQIGLNGNIDLDPIFCGAAVGDFTLRNDSPCAPFSPPNDACDLIGAWPVACLRDCAADCAVPYDGVVNVTDLLALVGAWGDAGGVCDLNLDGVVDVADLLLLVGAWGPCP